jgi:TRAP-type C4-dicarboxylate transport system permease small subunit
VTQRLRGIVERAMEWIVLALLSVLAVEVMAGIVFRFLGRPLSWYDEVASVLLAWVTYFGAALAALKRAHIGFGGLVKVLPVRLRFAALALREVAIFGFFALLAWYGAAVLRVLAGETLVTVDIPVRLTQGIIPVGAVLFMLAEALNLPVLIAQARGAVAAPDVAQEATE